MGMSYSDDIVVRLLFPKLYVVHMGCLGDARGMLGGCPGDARGMPRGYKNPIKKSCSRSRFFSWDVVVRR
jgi:hypothetical protein